MFNNAHLRNQPKKNPMAGFGRRQDDRAEAAELERLARRRAGAAFLGVLGCIFLAIAIAALLSVGWGFAFLGLAAVIASVSPSD